MLPERYRTPSSSDNAGWVLVYAIVFLVVIQAASLFALAIVKYNIASGNAFHSVLRQAHAPELKTSPPEITLRILDAPDGWDHAAFSTELTEKTWGGERSYSWRAVLREQPGTITTEALLSSCKPHLIILIDDSLTMACSCGKAYEDERIYLECPSGEITPAPYRDDVPESVYSSAGTYFKGDYGNTYYPAADTNDYGGTVSCWTCLLSYIQDLLDQTGMCEVAIASTSRGIITPFTHDTTLLYSALESLHPDADTSPLSERLAGLLDDFPEECITGKQIIVATAGISVDDGSLPAWLVDFDNDNHPQDCYIEEIGSHCLDDVAAYASSINIRVHSAGPDIDFLRAVAQKGGGMFMPTRQAIAQIPDFVCQPETLTQSARHFLINRDGDFDPGWLVKTSPMYYQAGPYDPLHLTALPYSDLAGPAVSQYTCADSILCSTSVDALVNIGMPAGELRWIIRGIGGKISKREGTIVAGPNLHGYVHALGDGPDILWRQPGDLFESSMGAVYIARDNTITQVSLKTGLYLGDCSTDEKISALRYDPCMGLILAGTTSGAIYIFDQDLTLRDMLVISADTEVCDIRTFSWRKRLHILAATPGRVICATRSQTLWSLSLDNGTFSNAVVMDGKAYISTWNRDDGCYGIDTGRSYLAVLDARSGEKISEKMLFAGAAFGPVIDPDEKRIGYNSWDASVHREDISSLAGISSCCLGSVIMDDHP